MNSFQAFVLGTLQGLSEFLPISSSAHLFLTPWLFGWPARGLAFDVALHLGTGLAVAWYFRRDWVDLTRAAISMVRGRCIETNEQRRVLFLIIATIPGAIGGFLLQSKAESTFRNPLLVATTLIVMGIILWLVDKLVDRRRALGEMRWLDALIIGVSQVVALVPGVSRSGATITAGRALRFDRAAAARFSFLMSMPITLAAVVYEGPKALQEGAPIMPIVVGIAAAAISGWLAIAVLMRFLSRHSYGVFAAYRVLLGIIVLAVIYARQ
ncbi:MAG: undecaprenyl-diphosphatase UppP [Gemmatimonadota bacterium]|nr:undecaprenyl-diphosphatase UppP [Gemmatimonadota bacterium]